MDASKLFAELINRSEGSAGGIITGTALSDSADGSVIVQLDGSTVAQPGEDEETITVSADAFAGGAYELPSTPYAGTLSVTDSNGVELEEEDYKLDGSRLTIWALSSSPVEISYQTGVRVALSNEDFDGDEYAADSTANIQLLEEVSPGDWQPATYTLSGNIITVEGIGHASGVVEFAYTYGVSQVCGPGANVLPNAPESVTVYGRNSSGVDVPVADYALEADVITLPDEYGGYTVNYSVGMVEAWNVSEQYTEVPLEDSDDAADPETVVVGHALQWAPDAVTSCTVDGVAATYTLNGSNVVVDAPGVTGRHFTLTYDAPVSLEVPASMFATGAFVLPSVPAGAVVTTMAGNVLQNTCEDDRLSIPSLVADSPTYSIAYTAQVEQDAIELPCTPYVAEGQFVEVAVVNGLPTVIGASGSGDTTMTIASDAADAADAAEAAATAAQEVAEAVSQHFWEDGQGVHVTEVTQAEWEVAQTGANQLSNSEGILLRDGLNPIVSIATGTSSGMSVFDGSGSASSNVLATFTDDGVTLGRESEIQAFFTPTQLYLANGGFKPVSFGLLNDPVTRLALLTEELTAGNIYIRDVAYRGVTLEYAPTSIESVYVNGSSVTEFEMVGVTALSIPSANVGDAVEVSYQTSASCVFAQFGSAARAQFADAFAANSGKASGRGSFAANKGTASGNYAFAAGNGSTADGPSTVALGNHASASGTGSVAIGSGATASYQSVALGTDVSATGYASLAQNRGTIARGTGQTALGRFNTEDMGDTYAVIIGNGTSDSARSNALTVDWSGNVSAAGSATVTRDSPGDTGFIATRSDTGASVGAIVGTGGTNHGLYSFSDSRWIIYSNGTDIRTGAPLAEASGGTGTTYGLQWQHLGSFTGTNNIPYSLTNYSEVMYSAKANGKLVTATVAKQLLTSSAQELWLGGGKSANNVANAGNLRAVINVSLTGCRGVNFAEGSTDRTSATTWNVYAR